MKRLIPLIMLAMSTCGTPLAAHEEPKKIIIYNEQHRRVGTIEPQANGRTQIRNNQNQITGYLEGNRAYDRNQRRTGTVGKFWK